MLNEPERKTFNLQYEKSPIYNGYSVGRAARAVAIQAKNKTAESPSQNIGVNIPQSKGHICKAAKIATTKHNPAKRPRIQANTPT